MCLKRILTTLKLESRTSTSRHMDGRSLSVNCLPIYSSFNVHDRGEQDIHGSIYDSHVSVNLIHGCHVRDDDDI